jgi:hypothetical protein
MQLHEAVELKEAYSVGDANAAVQDGWKLLAVASGTNGVTYVLGQKAKPKGLNISAAALARANQGL